MRGMWSAVTGCALAVSLVACGGKQGPSNPDGGRPPDGGQSILNACGKPVGSESEPNDNRDQATPITLGTAFTACVSSSDDHDFYKFTVPNDAAGGYVQVSATSVGPGYLDVFAYSATDNGEITHSYGANAGANVDLYFSAAPGQTYRLDATNFTGFGNAYQYTLNAKYTPAIDLYEPNDTRASAKPITLGTPVKGLLFTGHKSGAEPIDVEYADWFSFPAIAGAPVVVTLSDVPTNLLAEISLYDTGGTQLVFADSANAGASVTLTQPDGTTGMTGTYYVQVTAFPVSLYAEGETSQVADNFTRQYTLNVHQ